MVALDRWIVHRALRAAAEDRRRLRALRLRRDRAGAGRTSAASTSARCTSTSPRTACTRCARTRRGRRSAQTRDVPHRRGVRALDRADPQLHRRRDVAHAPAGRARGQRAVRDLVRRPGAAAATTRALSADDFDRLLALREQVSKVLEPMRANGAIGAALEAEIALRCGVADQNWLAPLVDELRFLFISGDVHLLADDNAHEIAVDRRADAARPSACAAGTTAPTSAAIAAHPRAVRPLRRATSTAPAKTGGGSDGAPSRPNALPWLAAVGRGHRARPARRKAWVLAQPARVPADRR